MHTRIVAFLTLIPFTPRLLELPTPVPTDVVSTGPPLSLSLMLLFTCCGLGLVLGVLVVGFLAATTNRQAVKDEKKS
jgi:hypothetical protein